MLKVQYAARSCYNTAELQNVFAWILCFISAFSIFLPDGLLGYTFLAIPFGADIAAFVLMALANSNVQKAANLRQYFDAYCIGFETSLPSDAERRKLIEIAEGKYSKNPQKAELQMGNTGSDYPPGVHDWYVFSKEYEDMTAKFECQRQNTWWDKKLFRARCIITAVALGIVVVLFVVLMVQSSFLKTLLCSAGLFIKLVERMFENIKYRDLSIKMDGFQEAIEARFTNEGIEQFQSLIDKRRATNVLGINLLHKMQAEKLTKKYEAITNPK